MNTKKCKKLRGMCRHLTNKLAQSQAITLTGKIVPSNSTFAMGQLTLTHPEDSRRHIYQDAKRQAHTLIL